MSVIATAFLQIIVLTGITGALLSMGAAIFSATVVHKVCHIHSSQDFKTIDYFLPEVMEERRAKSARAKYQRDMEFKRVVGLTMYRATRDGFHI